MGLFKRQKGTTIAEGLKITGSVTAEGLVEVNGQIDGDLSCTSLFVSPKASITGGVQANRVVVDGKVEGPIRGVDVLLKSHAHVTGDIEHETLAVEKGAVFDGRSVRAPAKVRTGPEKLASALRREAAKRQDAA
jgi:cytoskeletal protein CcmA (bactofilin family)